MSVIDTTVKFTVTFSPGFTSPVLIWTEPFTSPIVNECCIVSLLWNVTIRWIGTSVTRIWFHAKVNVSYLYVVQLCIFLLRNQTKYTNCIGLTNAHRVAYSGIYKRIQMKMNHVPDHRAIRGRSHSTKTF